MGLAVIGERIERALDRRLVLEFRRRAELSQPGRALAVTGEQPVHIGAGDQAVRETLRRRVARRRSAAAAGRSPGLVSGRYAFRSPETARRSSGTRLRPQAASFRPSARSRRRGAPGPRPRPPAPPTLGVRDALAQHLVAAAHAQNPAPAPRMSEEVDLPALLAKKRRSAIVALLPGRITRSATGSGSPGRTNTSRTAGSMRSGSKSSKLAMRASIGTAIVTAPSARALAIPKAERVFRRQARGVGKERQEAEGAPAGPLGDHRHAVRE